MRRQDMDTTNEHVFHFHTFCAKLWRVKALRQIYAMCPTKDARLNVPFGMFSGAPSRLTR